MEIKIPGVQLLRKRKDQGDPMSAATERSHLTIIIMNNLLKVFPQQATQSRVDTDTEMCERSARPDVTSWRAT